MAGLESLQPMVRHPIQIEIFRFSPSTNGLMTLTMGMLLLNKTTITDW